MKQHTPKSSKPQTVSTHKQPRLENKDNLDSRKNEEQQFKGDDITHNNKDTKEKHLKNK